MLGGVPARDTSADGVEVWGLASVLAGHGIISCRALAVCCAVPRRFAYGFV